LTEIARVKLAVVEGGALVRVKHPPYDVVVGLDAQGAPFALEDACPHSGASLAKGCVRGDVIVCPSHEWEIELASGEVRTAVGRGRSCPVYVVDRDGDELVVRAR
jgi:nitrite reductase (NADH) small subunit